MNNKNSNKNNVIKFKNKYENNQMNDSDSDNDIEKNMNHDIDQDNEELKEDKGWQYFDDEDDFEDESEHAGIHNRLFQAIKEFCIKNKKVVIPTVIIVCVAIIVIPLVIVLGKNHKATNAEISQSETATNEYVSLVAAEVGDVDDPEDPQSQNGNALEGTGTAVNASDLKNIADAATSNGIDVSKYQGKIDWSAVAASGIDFAMIRVGYRTDNTGVIVEDPYARYNLQKAAEAGVKVGVYFFSTAVSREEALEEAAWTSDFISKYPITYPVVYNCEGFNKSESRMNGISNSERTDYAIAFLGYLKNNGYESMLYASKSELENSKYWDTPRISANYRVWVAQYPDVPYPQTKVPSYSESYSMWQYTSQGSVSGISGFVDINVAYFTYDHVADPKDSSGAINADNPDVGITFTAVNDKVTAKELTNLRSLPSTSGDIVASITNGEFVTRIATGDNGWSKLEYNGQTVYAVTRLLTDQVVQTKPAETKGVESGITFTAASDQVTAKDEVNVRTAPNSGASIVALIKSGEFYTRTGIGDNGWSRLDYNGQTVYAVTSYLSNEVIQKETTAPDNINMTFTSVNEQVTAKSETNLRSLPDQETSTKIIATIKKGEYVTRTGTSSSGWSRLEYNGQTVYAITSYLTN